MREFNKHGLSRYIPADIRRIVRKRCKFACVMCRTGIYQYEHIDPPFEDARVHSTDHICCLCGKCHELVTRGHLSKATVAAEYSAITAAPISAVGRPIGPLDFRDGTAEIVIGGLLYPPGLRRLIRYDGVDFMLLRPGNEHQPGAITALFTDETGSELLRIVDNEWIASHSSWDLEVTGPRLTVRQEKGLIALQLRLDPPGRIVVERLDMRIVDAHVLATEHTYAVGRYGSHDTVHWVHAYMQIERSSPRGVAIEFTSPDTLERRDTKFKSVGQELATPDRRVVINSYGGVIIKELGIAIGTLTGTFQIAKLSIGPRRLADMRRVVRDKPDSVAEFIASADTK